MHSIQFACLWPGLAAAWYEGRARGLFFAVLFSWAICLLLLATFVWTGWVGRWGLVLSWVVLGAYWLVEAIRSQLSVSGVFQSATDYSDQFQLAQQEYLRGNWFEAEAKLLEIIRHDSDHVSAVLMLIGVLRRTHRYRPGLKRLEQLQLYDAAASWQFEIQQEKKLIERALADQLAEQMAATDA